MTESEKLDLILVKLDKIDKLESEFGEFKERLGRLESEFGEFKERLGRLESEFGEFKERLGRLESEFGVFKEKQDKLDSDVTGMKLTLKMRFAQTLCGLRKAIRICIGNCGRLQK